MREHLARYEFASQVVAGRSVLDVACGSGYGSAMLREAGAIRVVGVDVSAEAIDHASRTFGGSGAEFRVGSAERLDLAERFDAIVSFETIEHLQAPDAFLAGTVRLLAEGGALVISTPVRRSGTLESRPANPFHVREWSEPEFRALLLRYYASVEMLGQFTFRRGALPGSRSIKRWLAARRYPEQVAALDRLDVRPHPPTLGGFTFAMAYAVAVCRKPTSPRT